MNPPVSTLDSSRAASDHRPVRPTSLAKRFAIVILLFALFLGAIIFFKVKQIQGFAAMGKSFAPPPSAVSSIKVLPQTWQPVLKAVGTTAGVNGVVVTTDLSGIVVKINFESGSKVKAGDLLVQLDTRAEEASLASATARRELAKVNLNRASELLKSSAISRSEADAASAEFKQAGSAVEEAQATIGRKTIRAPFDGVLGIRQVHVGQYLKGGDPVAPLQSMDPIYVNFSLPQQNLKDLVPGKPVSIHVDGVEGEFAGEITAIDSMVDPVTRNIQVQATVQNPEEKLRAGMFVDVEVLLPQQEGVLAVPATAVNYAPYGDTIYVITDMQGEDGATYKGVEQRVVKLGATRGDQVAVLSGLKPGEEIATSGVFKLRNRAPVQINNEIQPANNPSPAPEDT
jgi:membrane fusion protein (multidrug efflux system)